MPVKVVRVGKLYRVVESETGRIARTDKGMPRDGGGHGTMQMAERQMRAMNMSMHGTQKKKT